MRMNVDQIIKKYLPRHIMAMVHHRILNPSTAKRMIELIEKGSYSFMQPTTIRLLLEGDIFGLDLFYCPNCGTVKIAPRRLPVKCDVCETEMVQAPIFVPYISESYYPRDIGNDPNLASFSLHSREMQRLLRCCVRRREYRGMRILDPQRPLRSFAWVCPPNLWEIECPYRRIFKTRTGAEIPVCCYDPYKKDHFSNKCKELGYVPISASRDLLIRRSRVTSAWRTIFTFRIQHPVEGVSKPLTASIPYVESAEEKPIIDPLISKRFGNLIRLSYTENLSLVQLALGVKIGVPETPTRSKVILPYIETGPHGSAVLKLYYRRLETAGIKIELDMNHYPGYEEMNLEERKELHNKGAVLVHTLIHAIIKFLPLYTGVEASKFFEALDFSLEDQGVIIGYVYDNSEGTRGATKRVLEDAGKAYRLNQDFEAHVLSSATCPLNCKHACRACLFLERCIWLNRGLDRHMLIRGI